VTVPPIADPWGVFKSPCDGVVWDSTLHGWTAQVPALSAESRGSGSELFSPAELGMEGAKLAAIRRRREMEAASAEPQVPGAATEEGRRTSDPPKPSGGARASSRHKASSGSVQVPSPGNGAVRKKEPANAKAATLSRPRVLPRASRSASPPSGSRSVVCPPTASAKLASLCASQRRARSASPTEAKSDERQKSASLPAASREASPETQQAVAAPAGKQRLRGQPRQRSPVQTQAMPSPVLERRQQLKLRLPGNNPRRSGEPSKAEAEQLFKNWDIFNAEVMSQFTALWKTLGQLQEEAQRERMEKEELRQENRQLQLRLDRISKDVVSRGGRSPPASGAGSAPPEDAGAWTAPTLSGAASVPVEAVQPIVAPSPPQSLMASFRQVRKAPCESPQLAMDRPQVAAARQSLPAQLESHAPKPAPLVDHPFPRGPHLTVTRSAYLPGGVRTLQVAVPGQPLPERRVSATGPLQLVGPPMARHTLYPVTTTWQLH